MDYLTGLLQLYLGSCVRLCSSANQVPLGPAHVEWMYTCSRVFCAWQRLLCRKFHHLWQGMCWTPTRGELYQHSILKSVFTSLRLFPYRNCVFSFRLQIVENWGELAEMAGVFLNLVMLWDKNDFPFYLVKPQVNLFTF